MVHHELEEILTTRGIKPTANRLLVLRTLHGTDRAMSLSELEARLGTVDKSSIFRALTLFLEHHLVHSIDDGEGTTKYGVCANDCHCNDEGHEGFADLHLHFTCERCHRTYCFRGLPVPQVTVPEGFGVHTANYMRIGLCPDCHGKRSRARRGKEG